MLLIQKYAKKIMDRTPLNINKKCEPHFGLTLSKFSIKDYKK